MSVIDSLRYILLCGVAALRWRRLRAARALFLGPFARNLCAVSFPSDRACREGRAWRMRGASDTLDWPGCRAFLRDGERDGACGGQGGETMGGESVIDSLRYILLCGAAALRWGRLRVARTLFLSPT